MSSLSKNNGALVLIMDNEAMIHSIRYNGFTSLSINENKHFPSYLTKQSISVFMDHFQNAIDHDYSVQASVDFKSTPPLTLQMSLIRFENQFIAIFTQHDSSSSYILSELIDINNAQANLIRKVHATASQEDIPLDQVYMTELTNLNSDLVNAQRKLEQRNQELRRLNEKLRNLSMHDELTDAYNRRQFFDDLNDMDPPFKLVMTDFNNFKAVNDTYGHDKGDEVLKTFVRLVKSSLKDFNGTLYRIGGDEFALLLPTEKTIDLEQFFEPVERALKNYYTDLSLAYGEETIKQKPKTLETILKPADRKMYDHKQSIKQNVR